MDGCTKSLDNKVTERHNPLYFPEIKFSIMLFLDRVTPVMTTRMPSILELYSIDNLELTTDIEQWYPQNESFTELD